MHTAHQGCIESRPAVEDNHSATSFSRHVKPVKTEKDYIQKTIQCKIADTLSVVSGMRRHQSLDGWDDWSLEEEKLGKLPEWLAQSARAGFAV